MPDTNITKSALASSMKELMQEKPFDKISVTDVCNRCGMNRKSFYYHFKDKYDLVNWIFYMDFISSMTTADFRGGWDLIQGLAGMFYRDQAFYRAAFRIEGQNSFREYFYESMKPVVSFFLQDISSDEDDLELYLSIFCDAFLAIMERWLKNGCPQGPEVFVSKLRKMFLALSRNMFVKEELGK